MVNAIPPAESAAPLAKGCAVVAAYIKQLPGQPGVYRMLNSSGDVLYVGKAKNLKNRVTSYARPANHSNRILRMIAQTASMEFITTATEIEALLLETNLIKKMKPRFNVLMRDDKSFASILITGDHEAPALIKHRGVRHRKGAYFGPFASGLAVHQTMDVLQKAFLLRTCTDSVYASRTRPCLLYQIKRCAAPCTREITLESYNALANEARDFLKGRGRRVQADLANAMDQAAARLAYEEAARLRDRLGALAAITAQQAINAKTIEEADSFALAQDGHLACIQVFFIRNRQNWGNRPYILKLTDTTHEPAEVLQNFIMQFYAERPCPPLVLVSHDVAEMDLTAAALSEQAQHKVALVRPRAGEKRDIINVAQRNARQALDRHVSSSASQTRVLAEMAERFGLSAPPQRIEVYDNSHLQGAQALGAMIVAGPDGFMKQHYRKWTIRDEELTPGDDYGMMREVFRRRFARLVSEGGAGLWPDVVLVDGGQGQYEAVRAVLEDVGAQDRFALIAIAKGPERDAGRERFFTAARQGFQLPARDPVLFYLQRLRDEAHRFAIGAHRKKRAKLLSETTLDDVPGIGPTRKRALLRHFGSAKAVAAAGVADLCKVPGISAALAEDIYGFYKSD